jgi:7,8-dihydropterin-6-yl-methyl-4-(beta-D-ribofuranosyl)aminobenzene 5'-phosphate synthase
MKIRDLVIVAAMSICGLLVTTSHATASDNVAESVSVTILSSNLANGNTVGEWGFSALVEVDGRCILFDAGNFPDTVIRNAKALNVDLSCVSDVVLSHFHADHTTGLMPLVADLRPSNPDAIRRVHVAEGFFLSRRWPGTGDDVEGNNMIARRAELETAGVRFIEYSGPTEISPSVWITGPVERTHSENTYARSVRVMIDGEWVEDYVPDSQGLTVVTAKGPIVLLGCGHSGSVNLLEQVQRSIQDQSIHALMGGMHLFSADDQTLGWTADKLREIGLQNLMAGHCTGIEPLMRLRVDLNLSRKTAVVGAVGSRFVYGEGIHPTAIAR